MHLEEILKNEKHTVIDVRSPEEFATGHVEGAINIPLDNVVDRIEEFKKMNHPIVLCCASGSRSRQAHIYLSQHGVTNTYNGGSWLEIHDLKR
jgi:rhodanese-related sulfurtransferase